MDDAFNRLPSDTFADGTPRPLTREQLARKRRSSYSRTILPLVRCAATFGATAEEIAAYLEVDYVTFHRWRLVEPELANALKRGREQSDNRVEDSLYRNALNGNVTAQIFWLKNRRPSEWRDVQNVAGEIGHYLVSDKPMSEAQWEETYTKVIEAKVVQPLSDTETKDEET